MAIANELSSEVAAALLEAHKREERPRAPVNIRDVIVEVHSTLRKLTREARSARVQSSQPFPETGPGASAAYGSR